VPRGCEVYDLLLQTACATAFTAVRLFEVLRAYIPGDRQTVALFIMPPPTTTTSRMGGYSYRGTRVDAPTYERERENSFFRNTFLRYYTCMVQLQNKIR
jgi:hypothetical protein